MELRFLEDIPNIKIYENTNLVRFTTIRVHVNGSIVIVQDIDSLKVVLKRFNENNIKYHILGAGSNQVLLNTKDKVFLKIDFKFDRESIDLNNLYFPASTSISFLVKLAKEHNLKGFEVVTGIPASLGGSVYMNAGTRLGEIKDIVSEVTLLDQFGDMRVVKGDDLKFSYRKNHFVRDGEIIVYVKLKHLGIDPAVPEIIDSYLDYRKKSQPLSSKNCGCVFKNPSPENPAGKIIDELGLKGHQVGDLKISELHGNFIENQGEAKAEDFIKLIDYIKEKAKAEKGIEFELEVKLI